MLTLSAKGDYGLMLLQYLAKLAPGHYMSLSQVVRQTKMPIKYVEKLAAELNEAGIIQSREGQSGGYCLSNKPQKIKLVKVLEALEGKLQPSNCALGCGACGRQQACERKTGWRRVHKDLYKSLADYTLADILSFHKK